MSTEHTKRCSALLAIRETYIKTIMRYHFEPTGWLSQKKREIISVDRGASLAQLVEHVTLDLGVMSLSPTLGVENM